MKPEPRTGRSGDLLGREAHDADGRPLGRIADLVTERKPDGTYRVTGAIVVRGPWGRLLGYERREVAGPWLLEKLARAILRRNAVEIPWPDLRLSPDADRSDPH